MEKIKYSVTPEDNCIKVNVDIPISTNKTGSWIIAKTNNNQWPVRFFTATTNMTDFIGRITEINKNVCSVNGHYRGDYRTVKNVVIKDNKITHIGQRVMVTEHINVNGQMELIATRKRILNGDLNFINVGWSDSKQCEYLRIDIYTGDHKHMVGQPCFSKLKIKE